MSLCNTTPAASLETLIARLEPPAVRPLLAQFFDGAISPAVTLMYLLIETRELTTINRALNSLFSGIDALPDDSGLHRERLLQLSELIRDNPSGCARITAMLLSDVDSDAPAKSVEEGIAFCKRLFDWSVQECAEASVALYSLGNPEILAAATAEVAAKMQAWDLLHSECSALEIGCGIGRFQVALAGKLRHITGIDVSARMIEAAQLRCAGLTNVRLLECSGHDLAQFSDDSFDLVFAVDSFPYLCQSGMALIATHFHEAARVLRSQGDFLILNFSYRDNLLQDCADVARLAAEAGFELVINGERAFTLWDGVAFHLRRRR
ncbi:MAG: class I SAM-dependent methyltransferase [Gammaproteobacteria bacterium]